MISEGTLKAYAHEKARTITIRSYTENGSSVDTERPATAPERVILEAAIYGGLLAASSGTALQNSANTAEYIADLLIPEINGYDSVYLPIKLFVWEKDGDI